MRFHGKLTREGKTIVVSGEISRQTTPAGFVSWVGYIDVPNDIPAIKIGDAFLELDSGQSGNILIVLGSYGSHQAARVSFKSNGPFR